MVNFRYESLAYKALPIIMAMLLPSISLAQRITTDAPALSSYADTEATTNVVFSAGDTDDRLFRLSLELNATADNQVRATCSFDSSEASVGLTAPDGIDVDVSEVAGYGSATCTVSEGRKGPARVTCTITAS